MIYSLIRRGKLWERETRALGREKKGNVKGKGERGSRKKAVLDRHSS